MQKHTTKQKKLAIFGIFIFIIISLFTFPTGANAFSVRNSYNWAGYIMSNDSYNEIKATWTIPSANSTGNVSSNAEWIGIGGQKTYDLIQAGTMEIFINGRVNYQAWVETLPDNSQPLPLPLKAGDSVSVSLTETSP